jgi:lipoprotein NlpI
MIRSLAQLLLILSVPLAGLSSAGEANDFWIGAKVFWKPNARPKVGRGNIDPNLIPFPADVTAVDGVWLWVGRAWIRKTDVFTLHQALDHYTDEIRHQPSSDAYARRGMVWDAKGETANAIKDCTEAIKLDPKSAMAYNNRGRGFHSKGDYDRAIKDYTEALRLVLKSAQTYNNRGKAFHAKEDYDRAIQDFTEAIRLDPDLTDAYQNRAKTFHAMGIAGDAAGDLATVIPVDPPAMSKRQRPGVPTLAMPPQSTIIQRSSRRDPKAPKDQPVQK